MKNINKYIAAIIAFVLLLLFLYLYLDHKDEQVQTKSAIELPLKNEAEYTRQFNVAIKKAALRQENFLIRTSTSAGKKQLEARYKNMYALGSSPNYDIEFYGIVIDQHGNPVQHADITYDAVSGYGSSGDGRQFTKTNEHGVFVVENVSGNSLGLVSIKKVGYEVELTTKRYFDRYKRDSNSLLWQDYTKEYPYVFNAWKVFDGQYPNTSHADEGYGFKLGEIYSMDFTQKKPKKIKKEGDLPLDLQVEFNRDISNWSLVLKVPNGGIIETNDSYMNLAPAQGYFNQLEFTGTKKESVIHKKFYVYSRGKYYSGLKIEIRPFYRSKSALYIDHVLNLDGNRNLEIK